jgi:hypothetical protein
MLMHSLAATAMLIGLGLFAATVSSAKDSPEDTLATLMSMERAAMDRWGNGDPDGFLEISDPEVVYFDPFIPKRINGIDALRQRYDGLRGKVHIDSL